ncbi:MAG: putative polysaccharide biosynthesis protein [Christensenellales bacterium]|jgi:stage V sporulation protein B
METSQRKSFVRGAVVLSAAGLLVKVVGVGFRIPLAGIIGEGGLGLYQKAYPIYAWLLVLSTAGMPTAIAKLVAERLSRGDERGARRVFSIAMRLMLAVGALSAAGLALISGPLAAWLGDPLAAPAIAAIAPALFFVAALSAYRGYFQGMNQMAPTAVSQVVEQVGKVGLGLYFAWRMMERGIAYGAAGALIGVTLSEVMAWVLLMGIYHRHRHDRRLPAREAPEPAGGVLRQLLTLAVPILVGASILPLMGTADSAIIQNRLIDIGYTVELSRELYGLQTGIVNNIVNMPTIISQALSVSLVPVVAASWAAGYKKDVRRKVNLGMKLALLIALPAAAGMMLLSEPIIRLFYGYTLSEERVALAGKLLTLSSAGVVFLTVVQTMTGVLNGMGRVFIPVAGLAAGAVFKVVLTLILTGMPQVNIFGAPVGTVTCYAVAAIIDCAAVMRLTGMRIPVVDYIVKPLAATGVMAAAVAGIVRLWQPTLGNWTALVAAPAGAAVFAAAALLLRAVTRDELMAFPGGRRLCRALLRLRLMKPDDDPAT